MRQPSPLGLKIPVLYVNPPFHRECGLIEAVSRAGGLGIVDHLTGGVARCQVPPGVPHGVRIPLNKARELTAASDLRLVLIPLEEAPEVSRLAPGELKNVSVPVFVEVADAAQARAAQNAGAAGLVARGNEGPGRVSETSGFVLLQELLAVSGLPLFLQGGVSRRTASGAVTAGATGVVLDVHLLLAADSALDSALKEFLHGLGLPATTVLAEAWGWPCRVYSRIGTRIVRELRKVEDSLVPEDFPAYRDRVVTLMANCCSASPDTDEILLPISEDIVTARTLADQHGSAEAIVAAFAREMSPTKATWPFDEGSRLSKCHGTRYPVVQGPMAHVSDNPDFLAAVKQAGALPFLALGNMPAGIAKEGVELARQKTGGEFGVGLIGLEVNRACYEAHLEIMNENPPPFAILAAGSVELAKRIDAMGTACYLHCPSPSILAEALKAGLTRFVFEGCESGGHIGSLGSLTLWSANLLELERAARDGLNLNEVSVLFAGGIATARASAFIAGMVGDLAAKGLNVGLQMGTAYLSSAEAVSTCAITRTYQDLTIRSNRTAVIGGTVNTRARAAASPMAARLIEGEKERLREGVPLRERKELYEKDNLGALRLASKGCAIDPETATWDCPVFCDLPPEEQLDRGLYLMGQVVALLEAPTTIETLHRTVIEEGRRIFETRPIAAEEETASIEDRGEDVTDLEMESDREPIAVVGIGLRLPGSSDSPETFWQAIIHGRNGITEVPEGRWDNTDFYYDADQKAPDKTYSRIGGFVRDFQFDPLVYRIPPSVARKMDRTQQLAVTCVAEALKDAGLSPEGLRGKRVGIILGNSMGGESTDQYAARVTLPRTLSRLEQAFDAVSLPPEMRTPLVEQFRARYLEGLPEITEDSLPGELANVISGRIANVFNLEGPNFTVDAACASSMAAIMNAAAALREKTVDFAITGGVDAAMHPSSFVKFCKIGALSPDGSRPFDESANGFVMGEGAGILVLKRLSDAVRDNDRIYGTILAIGSSSDGRGKGITAPNAAGQERAIRVCLDSARIPIGSIGLIEAHGTSTPVGDTTELVVVDKIFREAGLAKGSVGIGSVKSQIGHLKAAAGAAGIIKALLSLYHRTLPPTINVKKPNPCIDWRTSPVFLVSESRPWKQAGGNPRRAGVSAFGFGGTNFHMVLQEHVAGLRVVRGKKQAQEVIQFRPPSWPCPPEMTIEGEAWVLAGADAADLSAKIEKLLKDLNPANAVALAAQYREEAREGVFRCGFAAQNAQDVVKKLSLIRDGIGDARKRAFLSAKGIHFSERSGERTRAGLAFVFPGQGSQYPYMLRDLAQRFPVVAETLTEADEILVSLGRAPVTAGIFPPESNESQAGQGFADAMKETQILQPMILAADTAIFRLLAQFGVRPAACAGHSLGEYAACVAAGVFSFRDGLEAVAVRGQEMAKVSIADPGLMMSVPADTRIVEEVLAQVDGYVVAANKNSPKQTVISGETDAVKQAAELFKARGLDGILLPVSAAFHSGVVAPAREPFMKTLRRLKVHPPSVPVLSNVTGDFYPVGPAAPQRIGELLGNQFAAPVEWAKTLRRLYSDGVRIFIECGPKRVLTNLTLDTLSSDTVALPTNHPKKGGIQQFMETLAALAAEGVAVDWGARDSAGLRTAPRPELRIVREAAETSTHLELPPVTPGPSPLESLLDEALRDVAAREDFARFLEVQGEPIRSLIKSGYRTFVQNILPMEKTVRQMKSEGLDFQPVVVSGVAAGLPSDVRFPFDRENLDDLILGKNFIKKVPEAGLRSMVEKNIERLYKGSDGEAELRPVDDVSGVIKLAGFFSEENLLTEYGVDERLATSMDVTSRLALAAGIEALRDAGIPLVLRTRKTSTGHELPDSWALPESLREETGVIFAAAFPGLSSLVDEVTRETASRYDSGARKRLIEFYSGLLAHIRDDRERDRVSSWFTEEFSRLNPVGADELYTFNRNFLFRVMTFASGQLAEFVKAQGPNTHMDAACASTTQAVLLARDWIRTGQAKRVLVVAADDVAGRTLLPWIGSGFLAMGAATTKGNVSEAAIPFDDRRAGLILGSAAVGVVLEKRDMVEERGMEGIVSIEAGMSANSAFHGTRLDLDHISHLMGKVIAKWEVQSGLSRSDLAGDVFFMSHETYSPKRGGSAAAEIHALRRAFGDKARLIPIANTKGFTGHTMGVGVEDVVAMRCLQKGMIPPIANLKQPDPEFADLNLSRGGPCNTNYALRLAAGFGSQIVIALYKRLAREENRITDLHRHRSWLKTVTGYSDPVVSVENRTLRVVERPAAEAAALGESREVTFPEPAVTRAEALLVDSSTAEEQIREKILALLSEKTGYPADMLDTQLDLEADLGIDTVKQAEFISEVREAFNIPRIQGLKIADFPTIEHIIQFAREHVKEAASASAGQETSTAKRSERAAGGEDEIEAKILALLSAKTGYPSDMLATDLDLEADLGIDTVKQAEFISEVREAFNIPRIEGLKIADFPTIKHIIGFVAERASLTEESSEPGNKVEDQTLQRHTAAEEEIRLFETRLVRLPAPEKIPRSEGDEIVIAGGPDDLAVPLEKALRSSGFQEIRRLSEPSLPADSATRSIGIINLFGLDDQATALKQTFELYLSAARTFDAGPSFLVTAVSEDGAFGFETPGAAGHIAGAIAGATKAFGREYPDTRVRVLDIHPEIDPAAKARIILRSIEESFPLETAVDRDGTLRAVRLVPTTVETEEPFIRSEDVVLVSGGARGITAECMKRLAERHKLTFVILGRTPISGRAEEMAKFTPHQWDEEKSRIIERMKQSGVQPTPVTVDKELSRLRAEAEVVSTLRQLRSQGSEVIYRSVDIRDREGVDRLVEEVGRLCRRVDLLVHAAGIDVSRALRGKTLEQMEAVVSIKVDGMRNLFESLERHELAPRRLVGFGSVAGRFGNLAQVDYSAANDGLAHLLRYKAKTVDAKVSIIDWAPWSEVGMATRGSVQQALEEAGIDFISPETGTALFARELDRVSGSCEVLAAGRLGPFAADAFHVPGMAADEEAVLAGQRVHVLSLLPGEYVRARIVLDPSHPLLDHHRIDRAAVLPGVGGLEIMRSAVGLLNSAAIQASFEEVRFASALKIFGTAPFEAEIEVVRLPSRPDESTAYKARIFSWFKDKQGQRMGAPRLHHECRLVAGGKVSGQGTASSHWRKSLWIAEQDIYSVFFHGPGFRFLEHVVLEQSGKKIRFRYQETNERQGMFADAIPAAMEAAFQAAASFGVESRAIMALPTGIERAVVCPGNVVPWEGELTLVQESSHEVAEGRKILTFDGEVRDRNGTVIITLQRLEIVELDRADGFPVKVFEEILPVKEIAKEMETRPEVFLQANLTGDEAREYESKTVRKRAAEWITGRVAVKNTVQRLAAISGRVGLLPRDIRIIQDAQGKPIAELSAHPGSILGHVSASHSNGLAVAAAAPTDRLVGLGIDLEKVEAHSDAWMNDYFTDDEIRAAGDSGRREHELTKFWCLKEAALKALGTGLRFDLKEINVATVDPSGRCTIEFRNNAARYVDELPAGPIEARVEERDGLVIARALIRRV